jgi:hypothetical protein
MGFCDKLLKRRMFRHFFLNSMKAFTEVILLEGLPQERSYEEGIIGLHFLRMQWNIVKLVMCGKHLQTNLWFTFLH